MNKTLLVGIGIAVIAIIVFSLALTNPNLRENKDTYFGFIDTKPEPAEPQKIIDIARQFIITSPTYSFDGITNTLEIEIISADTFDSTFILEGKFKTLHTGYGNRANSDLPLDMTSHFIEIAIVDGKIISAVIDNKWDELNQMTCNTAQC